MLVHVLNQRHFNMQETHGNTSANHGNMQSIYGNVQAIHGNDWQVNLFDIGVSTTYHRLTQSIFLFQVRLIKNT